MATKINKDMQSKLDTVLASIKKQYGDESVMQLGKQVGKPVPHIPSGIFTLDSEVLGVGGLPKGRIIEMYGPEASGKTLLSLCVIAEAQRQGGLCAFVDAEHALSPSWAALNGVDVDSLVVNQPDYGEQGLEICEALVRSEAFSVVVVDSVAALVPKAEIDGEMGDSHVGLQARLMSQAMRKLAGVVSKTNTTLIFINQLREKIGVMFGSPETTSGGRALKFYASVRLDVRRISAIKDGETIVGNRVRIKAAKNKVAPPFKQTEVDLLFDSGFDKIGNLVDAATAKGIIEKSGSWYSMGETKIGQGRDSARKLLASDPELMEKVEKALRGAQ